MNLETLVKIAHHIEAVLGVSARGTVRKMWNRLDEVAGHCRTKRDAARVISSRIYHHECNGDYPNTDAEILNVS